MSVLKVKNLCCGYKEKLVINGFDLELKASQKLGLMGANGSGKSTLLRAMAGLSLAKSDEFLLFGKDIRDKNAQTGQAKSAYETHRQKVGYLFQNSDEQFVFPSVLDDVGFELKGRGYDEQSANAIARKTLQALGIAELENEVVYHLSGGQKRLVALAGVLCVPDKSLLILDEPSIELDQNALKRLVQILKAHPASMIIASHDKEFLAQICTSSLSLS